MLLETSGHRALKFPLLRRDMRSALAGRVLLRVISAALPYAHEPVNPARHARLRLRVAPRRCAVASQGFDKFSATGKMPTCR